VEWLMSARAMALGVALTLSSVAVGGMTQAAPPAHYNGQILSRQLLASDIRGEGVSLYRIIYWSRAAAVSEYVTEPAAPGHYPLLLNLHGGSVVPLRTADNLDYTARDAAYFADPGVVAVYPEYEGYLGSAGTVHGSLTDLENIEDGIRAAEQLHRINAARQYVVGISLGGGLALMLAGIDQNIRAVVCVSPWVGLQITIRWYEHHAKLGSAHYREMTLVHYLYGKNLDAPAYNKRSPHAGLIHAPVLLLQGTGDTSVAWQTVQTFYRQLKAARKVAQLVLYPGGQHGLHGKYGPASTAALNAWFHRDGLTQFTLP
jgi:dipeptidyl aminopeptidase/acylaminoacyl peptidase